MARKAQPVEPKPTAAPAARVVATVTERDSVEAKVQNVHQRTAATHPIPQPRKGCLVLDTNAFIKGLDDYTSRADVLVTTAQVIQECKDRATRDVLERLPVSLEVLDPTQESVHRVVDVASATGDLGALSRTDIRVCALALDVGKQLNALRAPIAPRSEKINAQTVGINIVTEPMDEVIEEEEIIESGDDVADAASDSDGEWITPENINKVLVKEEGLGDAFESGFACATADFPMQNVLMHVGVPVMGPRGFMIRELRQWLLRCHACFCIVTDTTRQFCPECGSGDTLKRVSYTVTEHGEKHLFINFKKTISKRGTIYNLPKPRGGRNGTNRTLVLREDQLAKCGKATLEHKRKQAAAATDEELAGFAERVRSHDPAQRKMFSSYSRVNMNERRKQRAGRKK